MLDFALKNVKPGETKAFGGGTGNKSLEVDNTAGGTKPSSEAEVNEKKQRVVK